MINFNNTYTPVSFKSNYPAKICNPTTIISKGSKLSAEMQEIKGVLKRNIPTNAGIIGILGGIGALTTKAFNKISKIKITPISDKELVELQSKFRKLFIRPDISLEETKAIIKRYQAIEKIEDKTEYIKAMYQEGKHNFGMDDIKIDLVIKEGQKSQNAETMGGVNAMLRDVMISPNNHRKLVANRVHHELRHLKQYYFSANYDKQTFARAIYDGFIADEKGKLPEEELAPILENMIAKFETRLGKLSPSNIPDRLHEYARKCTQSLSEYVSLHDDSKAYYKSFVEMDANRAGKLMDDIKTQIRTRKIAHE